MKSLLFTIATLFSINAMADQCQAISRAEAERAALLLQKNAVITEFCEPCANGIKTTTVVNKVKFTALALGEDSYTQVNVNGKNIDLAYTFIQVAPNKSINIAKAIACSTLDESSVSSTISTN